MQTTPESITYNIDCVEYMKGLPDKAFDLAIVDPPYGGGGSAKWDAERERERENCGIRAEQPDYAGRNGSRFGGWFDNYHIGNADGRRMAKEVSDPHRGGILDKDIRHWDFAPPAEYFTELARVSKHQIVWGGNYFGLPPTRCFLVWRKTNIPLEGFSMASVEYAWTSFNQNAMCFEASSVGTQKDPRFHPTQKPIALYAWIYRHFAKQGWRILDTHLGSGSSRIAAWDAGLDFVGCEIDKTYFELQEERFAQHTAQLSLFTEELT